MSTLIMISVGLCAAWQPSPGDRPMYDGPDIPSADLPEDITGPEPQLVPLDVSTLHKVPGYETVGYYADCEYRINRIYRESLLPKSHSLTTLNAEVSK